MNKKFRSFAFYLGIGYLTVYVVCTGLLYVFSSRVITKTTRKFDRQDVRAESEELVELINQNPEGNWLAEQVTTGRYPPSTIFIVRVISRAGHVEYTITWPQKIDLPEWKHYEANIESNPDTNGLSEYYIRPLQRHIQIKTTRLNDGRLLQVGKGSFLEVDQKKMMGRMLLVFVALSTIFSAISSVFMMAVTLRPIRRITASMSRIIESGAFEEGAQSVPSMITEINTLGNLFAVMTRKYSNLIQAMRQTMDNVAHDFRTPLTRIRGAAEMAIHNRRLPEGVAEALADIIEDCDRAKLQLQNIMDTREMESGFVKINPQRFNLRHLITEIVEMYSLVAEDKHIALVIDHPEEEITIEGDRQRLARVFANIIDNALKYTGKHGEVRVVFEVSPVAVMTCIIDNGIGIPDSEKELIWQRLFRGNQARESEKGLGLGLNIVQVIVAAHKGTVTVESATGEGSRFCVLLPKQFQPIT
ncbi:MAG: HAMP domain-containing sensor histidine kinase [Kiritimatiellae bacterium]|nr:HAMP domain-containing sensor histidine kinase [Kiritimatiellia bacterium]